jgi:hypothetical protein
MGDVTWKVDGLMPFAGEGLSSVTGFRGLLTALRKDPARFGSA